MISKARGAHVPHSTSIMINPPCHGIVKTVLFPNDMGHTRRFQISHKLMSKSCIEKNTFVLIDNF